MTITNIVSVDAEHGIYNRDANTMNLTSDVSVTTTDGLAAKFKSIFLDMGKGSMKTSN
ncbi:LPS export ABC transporter periplasmic protein LptC, partial [Mesorhizobium sp. M8A.F.Ca.ET.198.01.1.1]